MTAATRNAVRWRLDLGEPVVALDAVPGGVAVGGSEGTLLVTDTEGRERLRLYLGDFLIALAASPDGTRLAAGGGERVAVWDLADGALLGEHASGWCAALTWAAHSRRLAVAAGRQVRVLDRAGNPRWTSPRLPSTVAGLAWLRRDGRRVAAAAYRGVTVLEPDADRVVTHLPAPGAIAGLAVAPNGRWVVGGSQDATLHGWNLADGSDFGRGGFPTTVSRPAFAEGGRWLACHAGAVLALWDFSGAGPAGRPALLAKGHRAPVTALAWAAGTIPTLISADEAGDVARWRLHAADRPGGRIRPVWTARTADPAAAVAVTDGGIVSGHGSGAVRCHSHP
jgi:WD40 repeat protein